MASAKVSESESVHFSVARGYYDSPFELIMETKTPGAAIIYTVDGTMPSASNGISTGANELQRVEIAKTTTVRAMAVRAEFAPGVVVTHSYLFAKDILRQTPIPSFAAEIDQGMDPSLFLTKSEEEIARDTLKRVPSISILTDQRKLFGEEGIYLDPSKKGRESELAASLEWIDPAGKKSSQVDFGLRIQGSGSRVQSLKKNFRIRFSKDFGEGEYEEELFDGDGPQSFENLVLRNPTHDSWTVFSHSWRNNARYVNDAWCARTQRTMGHLSPRQRWVHLFLNGRYWGIYALTERPDEHFAASRLEKEKEAMIVYNGSELKDGKPDRLDQAKAWVSSSLRNTPDSFGRLERLLDVDSFIDYFIYNIYSGNIDWPDRNFYLIGEESDDPRFRFVNWDAEMGFFQQWDGLRNLNSDDALSFPQLTDSKMLFDAVGAGFWYHHLKEHAEFRLRFSDRLNRHLSPGGFLSPARASLRYRRLLNEIKPLLILESARWGDSIDKKTPYRVHGERWTQLAGLESWLFTEFFPRRSADLIEDFQKDGVFPEILPPKIIHPPSRQIQKNQSTIQLLNPNEVGIIIFTIDGSDPREPWTGNIHGRAYREPISLQPDERVRARVYSERQWSALLLTDGPTN